MINHAPYGYGLLWAYRNDELMCPANNHALTEKESITYGLQNFCRHLAFPSNCHLILMVDCSFWMVSCRNDWVKNSFLMVDYSSWMANCRNDWVPSSSLMVDYNFSMANYTTGLGKNSSTVDYSFSMVSCKTGLAKSFSMG